MQKREFEKLLRKYNKGQSTPEEESFIDEWFKAMGTAEEKPTGKAQRNLVKDRSWLLVRRYILQSKVHRTTALKGTRSSYGYSGSTWAIAASVLLVIGSMAYVLLAPNSAEFQKAGVRL